MIHLDHLLRAAESLGARTFGPVRSRTFDGFAYDSRKLRPGELFLAVRTEKADGHDFIADACRRGAAGVLCERDVDLAAFGATGIRVDDTRQALVAWAGFVLREYQPRVIAITGSVGKTSTQKAIVAALGAGYGAPALFDNDNFNDAYGLPIALGRLTPAHQVAVLELAADAPGDVAQLAHLVRPDLAVVTNVRPVRMLNLRTLDRVATEFAALVAALPKSGWAILNADDSLVASLAGRTSARVLRYGVAPDAEIRADAIEADARGIRFNVHGYDADGQSNGHPVRLVLLGRHSVSTALAALAVAQAVGLDLEEAAAGLGRLEPIPGRLHPLSGRGGALLLDDTFSASPPSAEAGLETLRLLPGRKVVIFGDVSGLGAEERAAHEAIGMLAAGVVDRLVTRGERAEWIARAAQEAGLPFDRVTVTHSVEDAAIAVGDLGPSDVVLVKGSEEARMEAIVARLLAPGIDPSAVLVRQDPGWRQRVFLSQERPTWVEIDLGAIGHNVRRLKENVGPRVGLLAVLKADAYGHGALRVARTALLNGATMLGTACLSEAVALRERGITAPILILGYTPPWQAAEIARHGLTATVFSLDVARALSRAALLQGSAAVPIHVKVDTGMHRLGLAPEEALPFVRALQNLPAIEVEGIFTHFACADSADQTPVRGQLAAFEGVLAELDAAGRRPPLVHAANSAATLTLPEAHFDLVRVGIALHGLDPSGEVRCPPDFRPALGFKTQIAQVKSLATGEGVSYGWRYVAPRPSTIAVIPVGYGDGFRRTPRHWGEVLVRGKRAPIVGTVCMDMTMIDVTDIPGVHAGDEVVLIGRQGNEAIAVEDVARRLGTINYEVITQILARVPREVAPEV